MKFMKIVTFKKNLLRVLLAGVALISLSAHATKGVKTHFVSGFVTTHGVVIPALKENISITQITGKLGGSSIGSPIAFNAIRLSKNLFLAQANAGTYKKGVFFEVNDNGRIRATQSRYCVMSGCRHRNLTLSDLPGSVTTSQATSGYGIFNLTVTIDPSTYYIPGFITKQGVVTPMIKADTLITKITGNLGGGSMGGPIAFNAIRLSRNSFLAQTDAGAYKKGVFFEIDDSGRIRVTQSRYCLMTECRDRNLTLSDSYNNVAVNQEVWGYGLVDLTIMTSPNPAFRPSNHSISGFVTTQGVAIPALKPYILVAQITGKLGGKSIGVPIKFRAIKLAENSFLAQANSGIYKKGVFFELDDAGNIKTTKARYCVLTACQNRNLTLADSHGSISTAQGDWGYGIFDLKIVLLPNLAFGRVVTQSSTYGGTDKAKRAVDGNTNGSAGAGSVTHTNSDQGAWWQVDLGRTKLIKQMRIFNRTDCCKDRLSAYQVSVSNDANFTTKTYQENFYTYPNPEHTLDLTQNKVQGRYIKIQLIGKNFLSLAEVQVLGLNIMPTIGTNN